MKEPSSYQDPRYFLSTLKIKKFHSKQFFQSCPRIRIIWSTCWTWSLLLVGWDSWKDSPNGEGWKSTEDCAPVRGLQELGRCMYDSAERQKRSVSGRCLELGRWLDARDIPSHLPLPWQVREVMGGIFKSGARGKLMVFAPPSPGWPCYCGCGLRLLNWWALGEPWLPRVFPMFLPKYSGAFPAKTPVGPRLAEGEGSRLWRGVRS